MEPKCTHCHSEGNCCCKNKRIKNKVVIDYIRFENDASKFAADFEKSFDQATVNLSKIVEQYGDKLIVDKVKIRNELQAKEYEFDGSPMIRVNEIPLLLEKNDENEFVWRDERYFCPPASFMEEKILMNLYRDVEI